MTFAVCYVEDSLMDVHTVRTIKSTPMGITIRAIAPLACSENRLDSVSYTHLTLPTIYSV